MSATWFTSDTHFCHANIINLSHRPFKTVEEMNETLIENWNNAVRPGDIVWHLGDVGMGPLLRFKHLVARLNGHKHLISGNHDEVWSGHRKAHRVQREWLEVFDTIQPFARLKLAGQDVLMSHFPYRGGGNHTATERYSDYQFPNNGMWLIHGHVHNLWGQRNRQLNVGVDVCDYRPLIIDEIVSIIEKEKGKES